MGLQRSPSYKQNVQPIKKTTNDENKDNGSINMRTPYLSVPTTNEPFFDSSYNSWVVEHPSALGSFDLIMKATKGKRIVVFLDYDGTLSPIVDNPDLAVMSKEVNSNRI
jgi:trehalose 6-phosphate phosphatase